MDIMRSHTKKINKKACTDKVNQGRIFLFESKDELKKRGSPSMDPPSPEQADPKANLDTYQKNITKW